MSWNACVRIHELYTSIVFVGWCVLCFEPCFCIWWRIFPGLLSLVIAWRADGGRQFYWFMNEVGAFMYKLHLIKAS